MGSTQLPPPGGGRRGPGDRRKPVGQGYNREPDYRYSAGSGASGSQQRYGICLSGAVLVDRLRGSVRLYGSHTDLRRRLFVEKPVPDKKCEITGILPRFRI